MPGFSWATVDSCVVAAALVPSSKHAFVLNSQPLHAGMRMPGSDHGNLMKSKIKRLYIECNLSLEA
jgi:hypothetical protein